MELPEAHGYFTSEAWRKSLLVWDGFKRIPATAGVMGKLNLPTWARVRFLLGRFFDLSLPRDEITVKSGMDTTQDYEELRRSLSTQIESLARKRDNASTLVILISLAGAAILVGIVSSCNDCRSQPQFVGVVGGLGALLIAAGAQLMIALRARVDGMIALLQRRQDELAKQGRAKMIGGRSRWFPQGAYHAGYITNVGAQPCIVTLPGTVQALATTDTDRLYTRDCWATVCENEAELVPGVTSVATSKSWNVTTVGPARPVRLDPGESILVGFGMMWGTQNPSKVKLEAGFPVVNGFGDWVSVELPAALQNHPDNGRIQGEWIRLRGSRISTQPRWVGDESDELPST